jgi:hypothetical protein
LYISLNAKDEATVYVHGFEGHPVIEHDPKLSVRECTVRIGKIEIAIMKEEGK